MSNTFSVALDPSGNTTQVKFRHIEGGNEVSVAASGSTNPNFGDVRRGDVIRIRKGSGADTAPFPMTGSVSGNDGSVSVQLYDETGAAVGSAQDGASLSFADLEVGYELHFA